MNNFLLFPEPKITKIKFWRAAPLMFKGTGSQMKGGPLNV